MGKTYTAYFVFSDENRAAAREEAQAAADGDKKVSVAAVAKRLGERWRSLGDAEKSRYKEIAQERTKAAADAAVIAAAEAAKAAAEQRDGSPGASGSDAGDEGGKEAASAADAADTRDAVARPASLPVSVVKRIMTFDDDVDRVSAGALRAVSRAAELFLGLVAEKAMAAAAKGKRKTLRFRDVQQVAARDRRLIEMGLQDIFDHEETFAEARGVGGEGAAEKEDGAPQRPAKKTKREEAAKGLRPISSFFGKGAAAAAANGSAQSPSAASPEAGTSEPDSLAASGGAASPAASTGLESDMADGEPGSPSASTEADSEIADGEPDSPTAIARAAAARPASSDE